MLSVLPLGAPQASVIPEQFPMTQHSSGPDGAGVSAWRRTDSLATGLTGNLIAVKPHISTDAALLSALNILPVTGRLPLAVLPGAGHYVGVPGVWAAFARSLAMTTGDALLMEPYAEGNTVWWGVRSTKVYPTESEYIIEPGLGLNTFTIVNGHAAFETFSDVTEEAVPEPAALALLATGIIMFGIARSRRGRQG